MPLRGPREGPRPFLHVGSGAGWILRAREPLARGLRYTDAVASDFQPLEQDTHRPHPSVQGIYMTSCQAPGTWEGLQRRRGRRQARPGPGGSAGRPSAQQSWHTYSRWRAERPMALRGGRGLQGTEF